MIDEFIEWLKGQPTEGEIDQGSWAKCAVGEFLQTKGCTLAQLNDFDSQEPGNEIYDIDQAGQDRGAPASFLGSITYGAMLHDLTSHHR